MSYLDSDALDQKRTVLAATQVIAQQKGMLAGIALANGAKIPRFATTKLEKKIQKEGRIQTTVTTATAADYFSSTAANLVVGDTSNFLVGDIIEFRTSENKYISSMRVGVDAVSSSTVLSVKLVDGDASVAVDADSIVLVDTTANPEGSSDSTRPMHLPTTMWNYTQIIRESRGVTGTAIVVNNYDVQSAENEARRQVLEYFARQLDSICLSPVRTSVTLGGEVRKVAGGLAYFADNVFDDDGAIDTGSTVSNKFDADDSDLTKDMVNDAFQYVIENEGSLNSIYTSPAQARKISGFDDDKVNINLIEKTRGESVQILKSPIEIDGNVIDKIFVSTKAAKDEVRLFNRSKLYLLPMKDRSYIETKNTIYTTDNAIDSVKVGMTGEWSFLFENADIYSYRIYGLSI